MNTLYVTRGSNILVDQEENTVDRLSTARQGIDYIYLAKEPMHVVYGYGDEKCELDVEKGDIIIVFYADSFPHKIIAVKNKQWSDNILAYEKKEQEEKEKWAASKLEKNSCGNCECKCC